MGDVLPTAVGAGVFSMLVTLFTLSMKAMVRTSDKSDERYVAEITRLNAANTLAVKERDDWRDRYLALLEPKEAGR